MRFIASFADGIIATVERVNIGFTYVGLIEGRLSSATRHYKAEIEERIAQIEAGRLRGFYCFEPELMYEYEFWNAVPLPLPQTQEEFYHISPGALHSGGFFVPGGFIFH